MYFLSTGTALMERLPKNAKVAGCFGLLCDEVIDISVLELLITFIQFFLIPRQTKWKHISCLLRMS